MELVELADETLEDNESLLYLLVGKRKANEKTIIQDHRKRKEHCSQVETKEYNTAGMLAVSDETH